MLNLINVSDCLECKFLLLPILLLPLLFDNIFQILELLGFCFIFSRWTADGLRDLSLISLIALLVLTIFFFLFNLVYFTDFVCEDAAIGFLKVLFNSYCFQLFEESLTYFFVEGFESFFVDATWEFVDINQYFCGSISYILILVLNCWNDWFENIPYWEWTACLRSNSKWIDKFVQKSQLGKQALEWS